MNFETDIDINSTQLTAKPGPGFSAGTKISTMCGDTPVQSLKIGALVKTHACGYQPVCYIGKRRATDFGRDAAVHISAGTFGEHGAVSLAQDLRILRSGPLAELVLGRSQTMFCTKTLVNGTNCTILRTNQPLTYFNLIFDQTQIVYAENLPVECLRPHDLVGPKGHKSQMPVSPSLSFLHELGF